MVRAVPFEGYRTVMEKHALFVARPIHTDARSLSSAPLRIEDGRFCQAVNIHAESSDCSAKDLTTRGLSIGPRRCSISPHSRIRVPQKCLAASSVSKTT